MYTKRYLALVMALVMVFSLVVPVSANVEVTVPTQEVTLDCGTETHATSKLTVYVAEQGSSTGSVAAVGTIFSDMSATLQLNYGNYTIDNANITIYGQTHNKANLTTFTLDGQSSTDIVYGPENENGAKNYFPGFDQLNNSPYDIQFVDALGTSNTSWDYTFKKETTSGDNGNVTLTLTTGVSAEADDAWGKLKNKAFVEKNQDLDDSFIMLAEGSYLQMADEKLTVNSDLKLDNFSNSDRVDANVTNAKAKLTYTTLTGTHVYQLLLKKGTQFALGNSIAEVKEDLLVTMSNVTKNYSTSILNNVYCYLDTSKEKELAESLLALFSHIAGLVGSKTADPVVITFGKPYTATNTTVEGNTTTDTSTAITVDTTLNGNDTPTTTVNITTQVTTTTTGDNPESNTTTTTKSVTVDTDIQAIVPENPTYSTNNETVIIDATTAVNSLTTTNEATFRAALEANGESSKENVLQTAAAANAIAEAAAKLTADQTEAVTAAKVVLKTELTNVTATGNEVASVTYDIKPVAQLYSGNDVVAAVELKNKDIEDGQTFTFNIPVPASMTADVIKVFHNNEDIGTFTPVGTSGQVRYITVTVSHFSLFELEPVDVSAYDVAQVQANLSLEDDITINFLVYDLKYNASRYTVEYGFTDGTLYTKNLNEVTPDSAGQYKIPVAHCAAKQMTDLVTFKLKFDGSYVDGKTTTDFSVQEYCKRAFSDLNDSYLHTLCDALLNYGASAQQYFAYKSDNLANNISGHFTGNIPDANDIPSEIYKFDGNKPDNVSCNINLTLVDKTEMNFTFTNLNSNAGFTVTGVKDSDNSNTDWPEELYDVVVSGDAKTCTVKVKGIPAKHLDHRIQLNYQYGGTDYTITFSPLSYVHLMKTQESDGLGQLCRAMYVYWQAANNYFINH